MADADMTTPEEPRAWTYADAKAEADKHGYSLKKDADTLEYRLAAKALANDPERQEATAYYTPWLDDAIGTMRAEIGRMTRAEIGAAFEDLARADAPPTLENDLREGLRRQASARGAEADATAWLDIEAGTVTTQEGVRRAGKEGHEANVHSLQAEGRPAMRFAEATDTGRIEPFDKRQEQMNLANDLRGDPLLKDHDAATRRSVAGQILRDPGSGFCTEAARAKMEAGVAELKQDTPHRGPAEPTLPRVFDDPKQMELPGDLQALEAGMTPRQRQEIATASLADAAAQRGDHTYGR